MTGKASKAPAPQPCPKTQANRSEGWGRIRFPARMSEARRAVNGALRRSFPLVPKQSMGTRIISVARTTYSHPKIFSASREAASNASPHAPVLDFSASPGMIKK